MNAEEQISAYISSQSESKHSEMQELHRVILQVSPESKLWFLDGKNCEGKVVANPHAGYGFQTLKYAKGETKDWFQVGIKYNRNFCLHSWYRR